MVSKITGKDGMVRGLKLKQGNGYIVERPLQPVCNLEIGGGDPEWKPNPDAEVFIPRTSQNRLSMIGSGTLLSRNLRTTRLTFKLLS